MSTENISPFSGRTSVEQVEEGNELAPKFDENGVIPCITQHVETREILMFAFMSPEALQLTIKTRQAHYWSRSRKKLWKKGETSGMTQEVQRILIDDDQDCVIIEVTLTSPDAGGEEASCHVGYRSCFYREIAGRNEESPSLRFIESEKAFDPDAVYGDTPNPTQL
ncbi:MAG: phosphoribosyl-AMP cyclohydrolase [Verrucomicrobiales bacterium]|nr:phosphoribosyl-AMP cyclohydrolase [Verrucomicrobiales bacterium]